MSQKKHKKRNPNSTPLGKDPRKLQQTAKTKRMDTLPRNLLLSDLVILAASQMMLERDMISNTLADVVGVIGVLMLLAALFLLFGPKNKRPGGRKL